MGAFEGAAATRPGVGSAIAGNIPYRFGRLVGLGSDQARDPDYSPPQRNVSPTKFRDWWVLPPEPAAPVRNWCGLALPTSTGARHAGYWPNE